MFVKPHDVPACGLAGVRVYKEIVIVFLGYMDGTCGVAATFGFSFTSVNSSAKLQTIALNVTRFYIYIDFLV